MQKAWSLLSLVLTLLPAAALAEEDWEREQEAERRAQEFAQLGRDLPVVKPEPGADKATVQAPPWCAGIPTNDAYTPSSIVRTLESAAKTDWRGYLRAAEITCSFPKEPSIHKTVAVIVQSWINMSGLSEKLAIESLAARMRKDTFEEQQKELCEALTVSDEVEGEDKIFMHARRALFGCPSDGPMWMNTTGRVPDELVTYLDNSAAPFDEMVRLAVVTDHSRFALWKDKVEDRDLLGYIIDQLDYQALSHDKLTQLLDTAPYKGNDYARLVTLESLARSRKALLVIDELVKKKSADDDWKELLVTAPQRGIAAWNAAADKWKDVIARSNEFERKFWGPSRKALKGCWPKLREDFLTVAKTLDKSSGAAFERSLSDPVASLLFTRLALCASVDQPDKNYAGELVAIVRDIRFSRGPRLAAYYAALEALGQIVEDRTKFPIKPQDMWFPRDRALYDEALTLANKDVKTMGYVLEGIEGIVKSAKKTKDGVVVTFATDKVKMMGRACTETNKILTFRADGSPVYDRNCKDTGWVTVDRTPDDVVIPAEWADGIKAGAAIELDSGGGEIPRPALPTAVYSDKSKKTLVNYYGFGL